MGRCRRPRTKHPGLSERAAAGWGWWRGGRRSYLATLRMRIRAVTFQARTGHLAKSARCAEAPGLPHHTPARGLFLASGSGTRAILSEAGQQARPVA